jgi:predicted HTH transcriptional regulator
MRAPTKLTATIISKEKALLGLTGQEKARLEQGIIQEKRLLVQSLEHEIIKTVAAFMNSEGGKLLIGVEDDGTISGIEKDYQTFAGKKNWDAWSQHFVNILKHSS